MAITMVPRDAVLLGKIPVGGIYGGTSYLTFSGLGLRVVRAAAADPQNVWQDLFTIAGGLIAITSLTGARTVIQAAGASAMQFRHSVGTTVFDNGVAVITGDAVGTIYTLTGDVGDAIQIGAAGVAVQPSKVIATAASYGVLPFFIVGAGTIQVTMTAAAGTGSTGYTLTYIPLNPTSTVVAA